MGELRGTLPLCVLLHVYLHMGWRKTVMSLVERGHIVRDSVWGS